MEKSINNERREERREGREEERRRIEENRSTREIRNIGEEIQKNEKENEETFEPERLQRQRGEILAEERRERKRKGKGKEEDTANISIEELAMQLQGFHLVLATITGWNELLLNDKEALLLAKSLSDVIRTFGIVVVSKFTVMLNFVFTCAIIYIPKLQKVVAKKRNVEKEANS